MDKEFRLVCKGCNVVHGYFDEVPMNIPTKCSACGLEKIAVEPVAQETRTGLDFDVFITNKKTALNKHHGFQLFAEDFNGKSQEQVHDVFIERAAHAIAEILSSNNINELCEEKK